MAEVKTEILRIKRRQGRITAQNQQVLRVGLLRRLAEIEAARNYRTPIDDHHLVMGNGMLVVDVDRHPLIGKEIGFGVLLGALTFVQQDRHLHPAFRRGQHRLGNGRTGKTIGLHPKPLPRLSQRRNDGRRCPT